MRILVTGSEGTIGRPLCERLVSLGHDILRFDKRLPTRSTASNIRIAPTLNLDFATFKPDLCIHLAAMVSRHGCEDDPAGAVADNVQGTVNVVRACAKHGVKLINFSTSEAYGQNSVCGEPDIFEQNGVYGLTKLAAEGIVKHYADAYGLKACSVRPFMVYGPPEEPNGIYRSAVSNFLSTAISDGTIDVHEGSERAWCFIDDFIDAMVLLIDNHDFSTYRAVNIGTSEYHPMVHVASIAVWLAGKGSYTTVPVPRNFVSAVKRGDFSYIDSLGFSPKVPLKEGMTRTYEWLVNR